MIDTLKHLQISRFTDTVIYLQSKSISKAKARDTWYFFAQPQMHVQSKERRICIDLVSGESQEEGEVDKRISTIVKVINSQVWRSYCPALYPTAE